MDYVKLSELHEDDVVCHVDMDSVVTVGELIDDIKSGITSNKEEGWRTTSEEQWGFNAKEMLEDFVEREEEVYDGFNNHLLSCITEDSAKEIQAVMEKMFGNIIYYVFEKAIILDVDKECE